MKTAFEHARISLERLDGLIGNYSLEQMLVIPEGYNNSMLWNYGHAIVTQQLLSYGVSRKELSIPMDIVDRYRKGSSPKEVSLLASDLEYFKAHGLKLIEQTEQEYLKNGFENFQEYTTSYGAVLRTIEDAILFNNIHMGLHLGYMMAMRKNL